VACDPVSLSLVAQVRRVASSRSSLLITGEPGVGKDLLASVIHYLGPEPETPFLRLDCAAFPSAVLESELFGHDRLGTWTRVCRGRIESAGRGTLVLDEIGALSLPVQLRLLRAIEEGRFQPNGSFRFVPNNVRIIALSSSDLHRAVSSRTFREDFYYRLAVAPVVLPPLRQRTGDIAPLCVHFLARACRLNRRAPMRFSPAALIVLEHYSWPGNVSELRALVERLAATFNAEEVKPQHLPPHIAHPATPQPRPKGSLQELERSYIAEVLDYTRGRKSAAAGILGISRKTLLEKRKRYGLD
jgi:DNA-binding NtrC family response regulator